jgi:hypothetical protein
MVMADAEFSWGRLGESWWMAAGAELRASPELVRFAAARHQGASAAAAARLAGITGTAVSIRQSGYRMLRTTTVSNLLALAAAEDSGTAGGITQTEIDGKLAKMIRSPDSAISIRAIEAHGRREAERRQREAAADGEARSPDETAIDFLELFQDARGAAVTGLLLTHDITAEQFLSGAVLAVLAPHIRGEFPDVWRRVMGLALTDKDRAEMIELANAPARPITTALIAELRGRALRPPRTNGAGVAGEATNAIE